MLVLCIVVGLCAIAYAALANAGNPNRKWARGTGVAWLVALGAIALAWAL